MVLRREGERERAREDYIQGLKEREKVGRWGGRNGRVID